MPENVNFAKRSPPYLWELLRSFHIYESSYLWKAITVAENQSNWHYKRWLQWIFICAKVALLVMRLQGEILGSQMRFSDAYLLDLFECLWSISQCLTTRVCIPWYLSHSVTEEQLFLPMDSVMGNSIGGVEIYTSHELGDLLNSVFLHFDLQLKDHNLPLYCAHIWGK